MVVNTADGTVWLRRAETRGGLALYAPQDVCRCPEFVMATEAELAEHGITGSADVLPMPVGPDREAAHEARRDRYAKALYEFVNGAFVWEASDDQDSWRVEADAAIAVADDELVGVNLSLYEEELESARLRLALKSAQRGRREARDSLQFAEGSRQRWRTATIESEKERDALRSRVAELEAQRERRRVRLVALQNDALNMRGALSPNGEQRKVPMPLGETLTPAVEWLVNRVAELEAERHVTNEALDDAVQALRADGVYPQGTAQRQQVTPPQYCQSCGSAPKSWCPDCAACQQGCFGGFDGNSCTHANAPWGAPSPDGLTRAFVPVASLREDPHDGPLHHDYRVGRDLPETGGGQ
jgi:hypothetical protein